MQTLFTPARKCELTPLKCDIAGLRLGWVGFVLGVPLSAVIAVIIIDQPTLEVFFSWLAVQRGNSIANKTE